MLNTLNRSVGKLAAGPVLPIWLIFVSLFGKCAAQVAFIIPLTLSLTFAGCMFCCVFWIVLGAIFCDKQRKNSNNPAVLPPPNTAATQCSFNLQRHQYDLQNYPQSQTTKPVSLPEAALHQGDAPPVYEEAVGMKTVSHAIDLPFGQNTTLASGTIFVVP